MPDVVPIQSHVNNRFFSFLTGKHFVVRNSETTSNKTLLIESLKGFGLYQRISKTAYLISLAQYFADNANILLSHTLPSVLRKLATKEFIDVFHQLSIHHLYSYIAQMFLPFSMQAISFQDYFSRSTLIVGTRFYLSCTLSDLEKISTTL